MDNEFQEECNKILDDPSLFEEDKVDLLEELVLKRYKCTPKEVEKTILDIMWRHKDPESSKNSKSKIVSVEEVVSKIDIPDFERRLELAKQMKELDDVLNKKSQHEVKLDGDLHREIDKEYNDLLEKTQTLRKELYGDRSHTNIAKVSPIDQIYSMFDGNVAKTRIERLLKLHGYDIIETATTLMDQLKSSSRENADVKPETATSLPTTRPFFSVDKKNKALCSFFVKNGSCLRADCKFSHDVNSRVCSYWLNGNCLAGDNCMFLHSIDQLNEASLLSTHSNSMPPSGNQAPSSSLSTTFTPTPSTGSVFNPSSSQTFVPSTIKAIKIVKPLKKPTKLPWDTNATESFLKSYVSNRIRATKSEQQRKKFARMSTDSYKSNDAAKAKKLSDKANKFEDDYFDALKKADDDLYSYSEKITDEAWFEMHGLEFNDAVEQLASNIKEIKTNSQRSSKIIYIVVPATSNLPEYKKTTKPVTIWLDHQGYRWQHLTNNSSPTYGSVISIDPWSI